jgi:hypothetical protein
MGASGALKFVKNRIKMRKLRPPKGDRVKNSKTKPLNITQPPKKFFVCCYVGIKDPK